MTGSVPDAASTAEPDPPPAGLAALRARRLLAGGLIGAHIVAVLCVGVFAARDGLPGLASAALAAALVIFFYAVGKAVQVRWADAPPATIFRVSVLSYIVRVSVLGALLLVYLRLVDDTTRLLTVPMVVTAVATVVGWLVGEILVFRRLRILNFDEPSADTAEGNDAT